MIMLKDESPCWSVLLAALRHVSTQTSVFVVKFLAAGMRDWNVAPGAIRSLRWQSSWPQQLF
jgi:hypothetical protein